VALAKQAKLLEEWRQYAVATTISHESVMNFKQWLDKVKLIDHAGLTMERTLFAQKDGALMVLSCGVKWTSGYTSIPEEPKAVQDKMAAFAASFGYTKEEYLEAIEAQSIEHKIEVERKRARRVKLQELKARFEKVKADPSK